jgi:hypothetical protein
MSTLIATKYAEWERKALLTALRAYDILCISQIIKEWIL